MDEQSRLRGRIEESERALRDLQRRLLFSADPFEQRRMRAEVEALQRGLFDDRKHLGALSNEPIRLGAEEVGSAGDSGISGASTGLLEIEPGGVARTRVFISYSHRDREWFERLRRHLEPLERAGRFIAWDDTYLEAGARWREEVEAILAATKVAVLLVSVDYLAADFIFRNELPLLLEAAERGDAAVLPVIVSPCTSLYSRSPLARFQAVNANPLTGKSRREQERVFAKVAMAIEMSLGIASS